MYTYSYDEDTHEFLYSEEAFRDPLESEKQGKDVYLLPANSTFSIPLQHKEGYAVVWDNTSWVYKEDHRQKRDKGGVPIEGTGTPYWVEGDTWESQPQYMTELGPLPANALIEKPEKPKEVVMKELEEQYTSFVQNLLDTEAQKLGYDDCNSVCTYVDTGVQKFDDEGVTFRKWRSAVWAKGYELLAEVQAGKMEIPTEEALIEMLPKLEITYN